MIRSLVCLLLTAASFGAALAQPMPSLVEKNGRHMLYVDGKPFFVLGGQVHNSSAWPSVLPSVWAAMGALHANTLEVPIYWEQVEPEEGRYDLSLVDTLLTQAREHGVHLVLLWFATWKNGSNHYMPGWIKRQPGKYPNCVGINGQWIDSPSPVFETTLEADKKAFVAVMRHLAAADVVHTVIMVQVENEAGSWGTVRDYSAAAQKLFTGPVPSALLRPSVLAELGHAGAKGGSWSAVFGSDADEYFHAWNVAHFIGQVAAAGKAVYPLPLYANAALRDPLTHPAASGYESGGPTDNVIAIWKAAAPALDLVAPDIYLSGAAKIAKVVDLYTRADNALFVPEAELSFDKEKVLYEALAHGGIGFSPFGIDGSERLAPFAQEYALLASLGGSLALWSFEGKISAAAEPEDHSAGSLDLGSWQALVSFGTGRGDHMRPNEQAMGKALFIKLDENTFLVTGTLCRVSFRPVSSGKAWQYLKVEEGAFVNGAFVAQRILNGDETDWGGPAFGATPVMLRVSVVTR